MDFVINNEVAIEVKATHNVKPEDLKGLRAISEEGSFRIRALVCQEPRTREMDGILILPWSDFIAQLWTGHLIS